MRESWSPPATHLNIMCTQGGMGDLIARIPAIKHLETYPHIAATVYWQDYFIDLARYLLPESKRLKHKVISESTWEMPKPVIEFDQERLTSLQLHLTDQAFLMIFDQLPPTPESRFYPQAPLVTKSLGVVDMTIDEWLIDCSSERKPYIVFTVGYTSNTRKWPSAFINGLAKSVRAQGLTPVLLGTTKKLNVGLEGDYIKAGVDEEIDRSLFVDLVDRTSLIECLGIIQRSKAVIGVDNGLLHLAACTNVPIVAGYTTLNPKHRVPVRPEGQTEVVCSDVPCINSKPHCQSEGFAINQDWRECIFGDYACTLTMSASRFESALKRLGVLPPS